LVAVVQSFALPFFCFFFFFEGKINILY